MRILCLGLFVLTVAAHAGESDIRVLIDVSGSMRQNDPHGLRIPALKLLLELLPPATRAGVWLFSETPENLISPAPVDRQWKNAAGEAAQRIHSRGRYTDIEKALQTVIADWEAPGEDRHIILLTDGMLDVSPDPALDSASRNRIERQLIPRLQALGARIYTIALSDQADHHLMRQLAITTDGWNETAHSAEQLQRAFLKIMQKATPREGLPLRDNRFTVDANVREFSLLVFRRPESPATELIRPDATRWSAADHPDTVHWHQEDGFDLITVDQPMPGPWQLAARLDPDNQVMIVTDLQLKTAALPNHLAAGESLSVRAELTEHDRRIMREHFLGLVQFQLLQKGPETMQKPLIPVPEEVGVFTAVTKLEKPGIYTFEVTVDGKTFQRVRKQRIEVLAPPVATEVIPPRAAGEPLIVRLIPDPERIDPATFEAAARIASASDHQPREMPFSAENETLWELPLSTPGAKRRLTVNFHIRARDREGNPLQIHLRPIELDPSQFQTHSTEADKAPQPTAKPTDWLWSGLIAAGVNLILGGAGFFGWRKMRQRARQRQEQLLNRLTT
ncbi:MAG: hypothetical protein Kow0060_09120 [Methylohalobius crimeensis]